MSSMPSNSLSYAEVRVNLAALMAKDIAYACTHVIFSGENSGTRNISTRVCMNLRVFRGEAKTNNFNKQTTTTFFPILSN